MSAAAAAAAAAGLREDDDDVDDYDDDDDDREEVMPPDGSAPRHVSCGNFGCVFVPGIPCRDGIPASAGPTVTKVFFENKSEAETEYRQHASLEEAGLVNSDGLALAIAPPCVVKSSYNDYVADAVRLASEKSAATESRTHTRTASSSERPERGVIQHMPPVYALQEPLAGKFPLELWKLTEANVRFVNPSNFLAGFGRLMGLITKMSKKHLVNEDTHSGNIMATPTSAGLELTVIDYGHVYKKSPSARALGRNWDALSELLDEARQFFKKTGRFGGRRVTHDPRLGAWYDRADYWMREQAAEGKITRKSLRDRDWEEVGASYDALMAARRAVHMSLDDKVWPPAVSFVAVPPFVDGSPQLVVGSLLGVLADHPGATEEFRTRSMIWINPLTGVVEWRGGKGAAAAAAAAGTSGDEEYYTDTDQTRKLRRVVRMLVRLALRGPGRNVGWPPRVREATQLAGTLERRGVDVMAKLRDFAFGDGTGTSAATMRTPSVVRKRDR